MSICGTLQLCDNSFLTCVFLHSDSRAVAALLGAYGQDPEAGCKSLAFLSADSDARASSKALSNVRSGSANSLAESLDPQFYILSGHAASRLMKFQSYSV